MISIITITYNAERWIETTIRSVLAQTCKDYEYIIVDGASSDGTMDIVRRLEPQFEGRLRYQSEPDYGIYDAMNKGLHRARGEFLWFINAGDSVYDNQTLSHVCACADADVDIIYGRTAIINEQGLKVSEYHKETPVVLRKSSLLNGLVVCHQAILVRRSIAVNYDTRYHISADFDWVIKAIEKSHKNVFLDEYVAKYLTLGISATQRKDSWEERFIIMCHHFGICRTLWAHILIVLRYPFSIKY